MAKEMSTEALTAALIVAAKPRWSRETVRKVMREARAFDDFADQMRDLDRPGESLVVLGKRLRRKAR
jgi:hypothetical protein